MTSTQEPMESIKPNKGPESVEFKQESLEESKSIIENNKPAESQETKSQVPVKTQNSPSRSGNPDYVPFHQRRLSNATKSLVNDPIPWWDSESPIKMHFAKVIAVFLKNKNYQFSEDFLWEINKLASNYLDDLSRTLHNYTELQRKKKPSRSDIELTFKMNKIRPNDLYQEYEKTKTLEPCRIQIQKLENSLKDRLSNTNEYANEESLKYFYNNEHYDITDLVPKQFKKPTYIPSYLPDLPPDYTYQETPKYLQRISDLKEMRLRLVEQSRLTEQSLYHLIDDDETKWRKNFDIEINKEEGDEVESSKESIMSDVDVSETPLEETADADFEAQFEDKPTSTKAFDIEAYAKKRKLLKEKRLQRLMAKKEKRKNNVFMQAETYWSPYAKNRKTEEIRKYFKGLMENEFKCVIQSIRRDTKLKEKKMKYILEIQKAKEIERAKLQQSEEVNIGFNFEKLNNSDDDDDDDDDDQNVGVDFPQFDFPVGTTEEQSSKVQTNKEPGMSNNETLALNKQKSNDMATSLDKHNIKNEDDDSDDFDDFEDLEIPKEETFTQGSSPKKSNIMKQHDERESHDNQYPKFKPDEEKIEREAKENRIKLNKETSLSNNLSSQDFGFGNESDSSDEELEDV